MDKRLVECQDCAYQWESTAEHPRCPKAECGRSRDVEPVDQDDSADSADSADSSDNDDNEDGGYTPAFTTETVEKETDQRPPIPEEPIDQDDDQDGDRDEPAEATPADLELDAETLEPALETTFVMIANRRGPHWELENGESEHLADAWTPVLNHYAPSVVREHTVVGVAVLSTFAIVAPRMAEDRALSQHEHARAEDDQPTDSIREPVIEEPDEETIEEPSEPEKNGAVGGYANV